MKADGYPVPYTPREIEELIEKAGYSDKVYREILRRWPRSGAGPTVDTAEGGDVAIHVLKPKSKGTISFGEMETCYRPVVEFATRSGYKVSPRKHGGATLPGALLVPMERLLEKLSTQQALVHEILNACADLSLALARGVQEHQAVRSLDAVKLRGFLTLIDFYSELIRLRDEMGGSLNSRPRSLDIDGYDTKFFEKNEAKLATIFSLDEDRSAGRKDLSEYLGVEQNEKRLRTRYLDPEYSAQKGSILASYGDIEVSLEVAAKEFEIGAFNTLIIVENLLSYQKLPQVVGALAIWGSGFKVLGALQKLNIRDKQIRYWGDLDYAGFEILAKVRKLAPQTRSVLMDSSVIQRYRYTPVEDYSHKGKESAGWEIELTTAEKDAFYQLDGKRIEQEHLHYLLSSDLF